MVEADLEKIEYWGVGIDTKIDLIDQVQNTSMEIERDLVKFETEFTDVLAFSDDKIEDKVARMMGFNTIQFENLITDWVVHKKIVNGLIFIKSVRDRIQRVYMSLEFKLQKRNIEIAQKKDLRDEVFLTLKRQKDKE